MNNYESGKIYKLTSPETEMIFIGSTYTYLYERLQKHKTSFKLNSENTSNESAFQILKLKNVQITLIELYPCNNSDELNARKRYWIDQFKDICVNIKIFGKTKEEKLKQKKKNNKKYHENNKEEINEKRKQIFVCGCGSSVTRWNKGKHEKSNIHQQWLIKNN